MSFGITKIPDECCTKTCLNPFSFSTQFLHIFIVLLHIVSTVLQYTNTVYTNVDPACITDCGYQIVVSSPFVQLLLVLLLLLLLIQPLLARQKTANIYEKSGGSQQRRTE